MAEDAMAIKQVGDFIAAEFEAEIRPRLAEQIKQLFKHTLTAFWVNDLCTEYRLKARIRWYRDSHGEAKVDYFCLSFGATMPVWIKGSENLWRDKETWGEIAAAIIEDYAEECGIARASDGDA